MLVRAVLIVGLVLALALARRLYRQWLARVRLDDGPHPAVPADLLGGADRTWVVFTTPYCASCEPVKAQLAAADPGARVVTVDATHRPALAEAFRIRSAPTALLTGADGQVRARLVGARAVADYLAAV